MIEELIEELRTDAVRIHPDLIVGDVGAARAEAIFQHLGEVGLLRRCLPEEQELVDERSEADDPRSWSRSQSARRSTPFVRR